MCGVSVQRPPQPISSQYPCSSALFVFEDQARGQRLIRSSVHIVKFLLPHRLRINKPSPLSNFLVLATLEAV
ncbi:unnamed protein product [Hymenolepis diminuta]|uniref:Uncharacterized protein n=1 Tax=Hymenolepis diminuta TaxID=6216 RepID=A0A564Z3C3_HYMDI|nr:unnamed protein product [Hymenolepis diminuta]